MSWMKSILIAFVLSLLITGIPFSYFALRSSGKPQVLAENIVSTPSPTPTSSPSPTATARQATPKPTATAVPVPTFTSEQINSFIERFAAQYGVDPNVLRHIALCESGFDPLAENVGYAGLYQFGSITWKNFRKQIGEDPSVDLRFNAEEAVQTAAYAFSQGKMGIWPNCAP